MKIVSRVLFENVLFEHGVLKVWVTPRGREFARFSASFVIDDVRVQRAFV